MGDRRDRGQAWLQAAAGHLTPSRPVQFLTHVSKCPRPSTRPPPPHLVITFHVGHQKWPWLASSTSRIKDATPGSNTCSNRILSAKSTRLHSRASRRAPRPAGRPRCVPSLHFSHQRAPARSTNSKTKAQPRKPTEFSQPSAQRSYCPDDLRPDFWLQVLDAWRLRVRSSIEAIAEKRTTALAVLRCCSSIRPTLHHILAVS